MNVISLEDLKAKLDRGDKFKLIMTLNEWAFNAKHIPGSINISRMEDAARLPDPEEEIIVYCSDPACIASQAAYQYLVKRGFKHVHRFSGGLMEWDAAGYPLEGESAYSIV
ncbi:MAG TPA: rhodanese-like domain-containing protein [Anaerolineales bacterium]|nr:rhodanese-like domain-containing protein [Anaerolineales bacterium]